ncbi:MAG: MBL fold metallo-hydrolase [Deltaproteobacteria bacterium]|nr:MBL fold metallo-hydrolase [Deltaproteobacteria bacterium]
MAVWVSALLALMIGGRALAAPLADERVASPAVEVTRVGLGYGSAYLVRGDAGVVLVDAGLRGSAGRILRTARRAGIEPEDIDLIVATHVHKDHAGGVAEVARRTGAQVAVQADGEALFAQGLGAPVIPQTPWGHLVALVGRNHRLPAVQATVVVEEQLDLAPWGISGLVLATPGHTACSQSLVVPGQFAVVGDLVVGPRGGAPNLQQLPDQVVPSIRAVLEHEPAELWLGHGGRVPADRVSRWVRGP